MNTARHLRFSVPLNATLGSMRKVTTPFFCPNSTTRAVALCVLTRSRPSVDTRADEGAIAATKLALDKALALFVKRNDLEMAAVSCEELAELHVEQREL